MSSAFNLLKNTFRNIQNESATDVDPCKTQRYSSVGLVAQRSFCTILNADSKEHSSTRHIASYIMLSRTCFTETFQHVLCSSGVKDNWQCKLLAVIKRRPCFVAVVSKLSLVSLMRAMLCSNMSYAHACHAL